MNEGVANLKRVLLLKTLKKHFLGTTNAILKKKREFFGVKCVCVQWCNGEGADWEEAQGPI